MAEKMVVTPWEVKGDMDYDKLIKEFGTEKIDETLLKRIKKITGELHFMLRRKVFFSHRDMNWLLEKYEKGEKFFLYTGRAPSGPITLGHLIPWVFTKWLQDKFGAELWFQFPDEEKFLFKENLSLEDTEKYTYDNMLDVIALGFDPKKTHFLVDTKHAGIMYKEAVNIAKRITYSTAKAAFGFNDSMNIGAIFYTAMQAVPAILPSVIKKKNMPCLIPLGIDQDVHFRVARDVYPKLGFYKPAIIHSIFMPGLQEGGKMSASDPMSAIYTTDTPELVKKKINRAFSGGKDTVEEQRRYGGNPDIDIPFQYLRIFFEPDDEKLKQIYDDYKSGKMLSGEMKQICIKKVNKFLEEHQKKREQARNKIKDFMFKD